MKSLFLDAAKLEFHQRIWIKEEGWKRAFPLVD